MPRAQTISTTHPAYPGLTITYPQASSLAHGHTSYGRLNRGQLLKLAERGTLWMRCRYRYTDDYAHDAATNYGRTGWFRVAIAPEWPDWPQDEHEREARHHARRAWEDAARAAGCGIMHRSDFRGASGYATLSETRGEAPSAYLSVYSGLVYDLRTTPPDPVAEALDDDAAALEREAAAAWVAWWTGAACVAARTAHQPIPPTPPEVVELGERARRARQLADAIERPSVAEATV